MGSGVWRRSQKRGSFYRSRSSGGCCRLTWWLFGIGWGCWGSWSAGRWGGSGNRWSRWSLWRLRGLVAGRLGCNLWRLVFRTFGTSPELVYRVSFIFCSEGESQQATWCSLGRVTSGKLLRWTDAWVLLLLTNPSTLFWTFVQGCLLGWVWIGSPRTISNWDLSYPWWLLSFWPIQRFYPFWFSKIWGRGRFCPRSQTNCRCSWVCGLSISFGGRLSFLMGTFGGVYWLDS